MTPESCAKRNYRERENFSSTTQRPSSLLLDLFVRST